jgi:hypothetical protein
MLFATTVWLTAWTTLFASAPHFECVCPDGSRAPCCLSWFAANSCEAPALTPVKAGCSHCKAAKPAPRTEKPVAISKNRSGLPAIGKAACEKAIVFSADMLTDHGATIVDHRGDVLTAPLPLPDDASGFSNHASVSMHAQRADHSLLPPTDFVVVHQQFVI